MVRINPKTLRIIASRLRKTAARIRSKAGPKVQYTQKNIKIPMPAAVLAGTAAAIIAGMSQIKPHRRGTTVVKGHTRKRSK